MRLICSKCPAQYELPDDAIPASGREVQCSNCGATWFQAPVAPSAADDRSDNTPPRRPLDPAVADILRAEVEHEAAVRATAASGTPVPPPAPAASIESLEADPLPEPTRRGGFAWGFVLTLAFMGLCTAVYSYAPQIEEALPDAKPALDSYIASVDAARSWLDAQFAALVPAASE